ncbi:MAG: aminotransferase class I/II-fold pyridoxal phosphate-dependent enzyme [Saprospiraceae bacterium]|nr:aminotransferase class I/II-fold pyridoxal phosphate-dependent enzyme [Saprospiraceae bacterium]
MTENQNLRELSQMATHLIPSEIIRLGNEINKLIQEGHQIYNMTIGDFDPKIFPIPEELRDFIVEAYHQSHTNYPPAHGMPELRKAISNYINRYQKLNYPVDQILVSGGSRPLIYAAYLTIVDPGEKVIYPIPSWNNNHYSYLAGAIPVELLTQSGYYFMPRLEELEVLLGDAVLLALCSPQNPTGTMFSRESMMDISTAVLKENLRRKGKKKPIYILFDQIYSQLCFDEHQHLDPVNLVPELRDYVIYIDGMSKSFAATGVRVGWAFGPLEIINRMRAILSHIGAWSPKAEQVATARYLEDFEKVDQFLSQFKREIHLRLFALYQGLEKLKMEGFPVEVVKPQGAIYLTVRFPWKGLSYGQGLSFESQSTVTEFLLKQCHWAIVPFMAFGADKESDWYRISVGTIDLTMIPDMLDLLKAGMMKFLK